MNIIRSLAALDLERLDNEDAEILDNFGIEVVSSFIPTSMSWQDFLKNNLNSTRIINAIRNSKNYYQVKSILKNAY